MPRFQQKHQYRSVVWYYCNEISKTFENLSKMYHGVTEIKLTKEFQKEEAM